MIAMVQKWGSQCKGYPAEEYCLDQTVWSSRSVYFDMICIHAIAFIDWKGHIFPSHSTQSSFWGHQYLNRNLGPAAPFEKSLFKFLRHLCICEQPSKWWLTSWWIGKIRGQSLQVQVCVAQLHKAWVGKCLFEKMRWWTPQVWEQAKTKILERARSRESQGRRIDSCWSIKRGEMEKENKNSEKVEWKVGRVGRSYDRGTAEPIEQEQKTSLFKIERLSFKFRN